VAGVIVHSDTQIGPLEDALQAIVDEHVDESRRDGFILHASALFSGNKNELPPELWEESIRLRMLDQIMAIPGKLKLPICIGYVDTKKFAESKKAKEAKKQELRIAMHAAAIAECVMAIEQWMRGNTKEVADIVVENNDEVRKAARKTHVLMKSNRAAETLNIMNKELLPLVRIKDGINFQFKEESKALQLADACSWCYFKQLGRDSRTSHLYARLKPQIYSTSMTSFDAAALLSPPGRAIRGAASP
jgi:hypothetical protein